MGWHSTPSDASGAPDTPAIQPRDGIGRLPGTQRLAVTMRKLHDLPCEAIDASVDCSAEHAQAHLVQTMRKIRHGLDGLGPHPRR